MIDMLSGIVKINKDLADILSYPYDYEYSRYIIKELEELNVKGIVFEGNTILRGNIRVLGKGCTSIVVKALRSDDSVCALKIMRSDSARVSVEHEASILKIVNSIGIGPRLFDYTKHMLMIEFIDGLLIKKWLAIDKPYEYTKEVIRDLLKQCYTLDLIGVDHGELSNMYRHVIISGNRACIIDFESASIRRRVNNLTSAMQYLFLSNSIIRVDRSRLIKMLRDYKHDINEIAFHTLLELIE